MKRPKYKQLYQQAVDKLVDKDERLKVQNDIIRDLKNIARDYFKRLVEKDLQAGCLEFTKTEIDAIIYVSEDFMRYQPEPKARAFTHVEWAGKPLRCVISPKGRSHHV